MKKVISIALMLIITLGLFACGNGTQTSDQPSSSAPSNAASNAPSDAPSNAPSSNAPSSAPSSSQAPDSGQQAAPGGTTAGTIGFWEDALESAKSGRDTYHIVMLSTSIYAQWTYMVDVAQMLEDVLNIRVSMVTANGDGDRMMTLIEETCSDKTVVGCVVDISNFYQARSRELFEEYGMVYVNVLDAMYADTTDPAKRINVTPSCVIDPYQSGQVGIQWCADNYKSYWGDIDTTKLGFVGTTWSSSYDMHQRAVGAFDKFGELFPEASQNRYYADSTAGQMTVETFYQVVTATLTAHPEIEYWFLFAASGDSGGTASIRGIEDTGKSDCTLMVTGVPTTATIEWDSGNIDSAWVASVDCRYPEQIATALAGVIAMVDGRATMETLWQEYNTGEHEATLLKIPPTVITASDYKHSRNEEYAEYGLTLPYPGA